MQFLEAGLEAAGAHSMEPVNRELVGAAGWVEFDPAMADDLQAVCRLDRELGNHATPDDSAEQGRLILE